MVNEIKAEKDKRCVRLRKAFVLEAKHLVREETNCKMSLGYFDSIEIEELSCGANERNWLESAWKKSIKLSGEANSEIYEHSLYITAQGDEVWKNKILQFWIQQTHFLMITFVHFVTQKGKPCDFFSEIEKEIESIVEIDGTKKVNVACYHSIDVSDMVIIWKSDYLVEALECLQKMYLMSQIGDLHTICSISIGDDVLTRDQNEIIPYTSLRLGVKDAEMAKNFFDKLKENKTLEFMKNEEPYITTGTEDIDVTLKNVKVSDFLLLMKTITEDSEINRIFCHAFSESATHLGIVHLGKKAVRKIEVSQDLTKRCELLLEFFQEVRKKIKDQETEPTYSWVKLVSIQLNALVSMSRNCVRDRFCYLIMDSVQTYCEILSEWIEIKKPITSERLRMIQKFVRGWGVLMDQTVRADGQFTQDTGVNPVLYDIPVSLLEFYIAFTRRCMRLLQTSDEFSEKEHGIFLMPNLCRRAKVEDVFDNPPPAKRLLYVDVPLDYLYKPRQVLYQLCHEISHFCGEEPRSRNTRIQTFTMNCAQLIVQRLHIESVQMTRNIYQELCTVWDKSATHYMRKTSQTIWKKMYEILMNRKTVQDWINRYLDIKFLPGRLKEDKRYELITDYDRNVELIITDLKEDVERLVLLYTECYADVSMIFLLQPSCAEYIMLYHQEQEWLDMNEDDGVGSYNELVQRIALVLLTVPEDVFTADAETVLTGIDKKLLNDAQRLADDLRNHDQNPQIYLPGSVLTQIYLYLQYCYRRLNNLYMKNPELDKIRDTFRIVTDDFSDATAEYRETIYLYEKEMQDSIFWRNKE